MSSRECKEVPLEHNDASSSQNTTVPEGANGNDTNASLTKQLTSQRAASAALARQHQEATRGIKNIARATELREAQERRELVGRLTERCAQRGEPLPFGTNLASVNTLRSALYGTPPAADQTKVTFQGD